MILISLGFGFIPNFILFQLFEPNYLLEVPHHTNAPCFTPFCEELLLSLLGQLGHFVIMDKLHLGQLAGGCYLP